ncbi:hypothetical protein D3C80_1383610 [compost metagenome]
MVAECPRGQGGGLDVGQGEARVLKVQHPLAENLALLGVFQSQGQRALHGCSRVDGNLHALVRQLVHQGVEALALDTAEQAVCWHLTVVKEQLSSVLGGPTDLVQGLAAAKAR